MRPGPDRLQPRPLHHSPFRPGVHRAHSRQALPGGGLRGAGLGAVLQRLPGQRRYSRLRVAGGREALRRGAAGAPRPQPVCRRLRAGVLPQLRGQVPAGEHRRPGGHSRREALHGRPGSDHPTARGPRERAQRPPQDRRRRRRAGGIVLRLLPRPAGLSAESLRGQRPAGRHAGAGHSRLSPAARDRRPRGPDDREHGRGAVDERVAGRGLHPGGAPGRGLRRRVSRRRRAAGHQARHARRRCPGRGRRPGLPADLQPAGIGAGGQGGGGDRRGQLGHRRRPHRHPPRRRKGLRRLSPQPRGHAGLRGGNRGSRTRRRRPAAADRAGADYRRGAARGGGEVRARAAGGLRSFRPPPPRGTRRRLRHPRRPGAGGHRPDAWIPSPSSANSP